MMTADHVSAAGSFAGLDWLVVAGYLVATTFIGAKLAGKQASIRDFFLGGRKLPWYAVSGSIIATEISAVTFVGVPYTVYSGNMTYLQLGLGAVAAKVIVGFVFVPAFYKQEIYSPYDYMEQRLGPGAKRVTTALFTVGQLLGQGVRVYLTALVLEVVTDGRLSLAASIWTIGAVAIAWTLLGGIATVIWTDVLLFLAFVAGAIASLWYVAGLLPGGVSQIVQEGISGGKFRIFDLSADPTLDFTLWAGILAGTVFNLNAYGTDQLIAQRMFCCRSRREARWAMISSSAGLLVTALIMLVGVGLYSYYSHVAMSPQDAAAVAEKGDRLFPLFIVRVLPAGLTGLLVAAIFAAAISSLDSILAALSQTSASLLFRARETDNGNSDDARDRTQLLVSRCLVVFWGLVLCGMAHVGDWASQYHKDALRLALSMASYTGGALLAGFMLAFLRLNVNDRGLVWAAPVSVLTVFAVAWHQAWAHAACWIGAAAVLVAWLIVVGRNRRSGDGAKTVVMMLSLAITIGISYFGYWPGDADAPYRTLSWPWFVPVGFVIAFGLGYLLADRRWPQAESVVE